MTITTTTTKTLSSYRGNPSPSYVVYVTFIRADINLYLYITILAGSDHDV